MHVWCNLVLIVSEAQTPLLLGKEITEGKSPSEHQFTNLLVTSNQKIVGAIIYKTFLG